MRLHKPSFTCHHGSAMQKMASQEGGRSGEGAEHACPELWQVAHWKKSMVTIINEHLLKHLKFAFWRTLPMPTS